MLIECCTKEFEDDFVKEFVFVVADDNEHAVARLVYILECKDVRECKIIK